ncbi:MAG: hypothetical protein P8184_08760 [Calditrichia bacterium]
MKTIPAILMLLFTGSLLFNCSTSQEPLLSSETYNYAAWDDANRRIVTGWFRLHFTDSARVTGNWHFQKTANAQNSGPQSGEGRLEGRVQDGTISINLNPDYVDNNVFLIGSYTRFRITGKWQYVSFIGVTSEGDFKAVRF